MGSASKPADGLHGPIKYHKGPQHVLDLTYRTRLPKVFRGRPKPVITKYVCLSPQGILTVFPGFGWDGPAAVWAFPSLMRASLVRNALCSLLRDGLLEVDLQDQVDALWRQIAVQDVSEGLWATVRSWWRQGPI